MIICGVGCFKTHIFSRQTLESLHVCVDFKVEAAFEFCALSGKFLGIERDVLKASSGCAYTDKVGHPAGTAERSAAGAYATDASGFLTCADLLHLDPDFECIGKNLDELTEVDAFVGDIIEYRFVAIALIFHVADLHVEFQIFGNLACADHRVVLFGSGFLESVEIGRFGFTEHAFNLGVAFHAGFAHLSGYEFPGQGDLTDIVAWRGFNSDNVADREWQMERVAVESFPGVLELYFNNVETRLMAGNVGQPVVAVQFASRMSVATSGSIADRRVSGIFACGFFGYVIVFCSHGYLAKLTERVSRITVIFTCPG